MKLVTAAQMRSIDQRAISEFEIPGEELMDRAGLGVAEIVEHLARLCGYSGAAVQLIAGRGNNGGDAFVAARYLKERGFYTEVWLAGESGTIQGDALQHLVKMKSAGVVLKELPTKEDWDDAILSGAGGGEFIVDGVLGTGLKGPARGPSAGAIRYINERGRDGFVVAIDVPSGLDADTGETAGSAVTADVTATMGLPKRGLVEPAAAERVGNVEVIDIGLPPELIAAADSDRELLTARDLRGIIPRRARQAHKGTFGHVLLVGGAAGYAGAIAMAARAATRSGVGLVSALVPARIAPIVAGLVPEAMVHGGEETAEGSLAATACSRWGRSLNDFDAVLIGPGMTPREDTRLLVEQFLAESAKPLVVDADALNVCAGQIGRFRRAVGPLILTPHPGEMGRLRGGSAAEVQSDRFGSARRASDEAGAVVVLKGAGTVVAAPGRPLQINMTGNPGMATGGMGDVLAGLVAGLAAQRLDPFDAARVGVFLHGRAGDNVAWSACQAGMTAGDVVEELPDAFRELTFR
jgi:NAD(P)H-hydrate epimerase